MRQTIIIFDGNNQAFRTFVTGELSTSDGIETTVPFGLIKNTQAILSRFNVNNYIYVWDSGSSKRRLNIYKNYKANRRQTKPIEEMSIQESLEAEERAAFLERFYAQLGMTKRILQLMGAVQRWITNVEADDVIAVLANDISKHNNVIIVTSDKDMYQLINDTISIYNPTRKMLYDKQIFEKTFDLTPQQYAFMRPMLGDPSDNIPGVKGVGDKTAAKIIKDLPQLNTECLFDVISKPPWVNKKIAHSILNMKEQIQLNLKLMSLDAEFLKMDHDIVNYKGITTLECMAHALKTKMVNKRALMYAFQRLEFRNFLANLDRLKQCFNMVLTDE